MGVKEEAYICSVALYPFSQWYYPLVFSVIGRKNIVHQREYRVAIE